ncbi:MAG: helix-turn-helix transcriptional regulator [Erysipelotrichaceae bacterium]|nr:helix-turn-helix transcriptional regulator [Erysipelotrichaceae bacterium]
MAKKNVGTLIKEARTAAGWTQAQLARKVSGLSADDISKIERGVVHPSDEQLRKLAKVLGVTQKSLLEAPKGGTSSKTTSSTKPSSSSSSSSASKTSMKVTATEKKLVELYRKADTKTKKAAMDVLKEDETDLQDLLSNLLGNIAGNNNNSSSSNNSPDLLQALQSLIFKK